MNIWKAGAAVALILPAILAAPAHAQYATEAERQSVGQRARPDYDPLGARLGSFLLYPSLDLGETYDTNVFVTQTDPKSDFVTDVKPSVQLRSNWNNHALNFVASDEIKRYATQVGENNSNVLLSTDGRLDIQRDIYVTGRLSYQRLHEDRGSPNTVVNSKNPIAYQLASAAVGFVHETGRLGLRIDGNVDSYNYDNGVTLTGTPIRETGRNRIEYSVAPRLGYEIVPGYEAFVRTRLNWRDYMAQFDAPPPTGVDRTSHGYEVDAGTAIRLGPTMNGELFAGYFKQLYDDSRLSSTSGPSFGGNLLWNVTELTSIRSSLARTVEETVITNASTFVQTAASVSAEHELRRNVLLTAGSSYTIQDFQGVTRTDKNYEADIGARYLMNRHLVGRLGISWLHRNSNVSGNDYQRYLFSVNLRLQF